MTSVRNSKGTYQRVFVGYNCSYNTRLSFDFDRDMLERTLNAIAESKAEPELSIRFTVRDDSAVKSALLEAAAENAREKAQILCRASGVELGRLLTVNYDWSEIDLISPTGYAIERASLKRSAAVPGLHRARRHQSSRYRCVRLGNRVSKLPEIS